MTPSEPEHERQRVHRTRDPKQQTYLTTKGAAELMGIGYSTLRLMIKNGTAPNSVLVCGCERLRRFDSDVIRAFMAGGQR